MTRVLTDEQQEAAQQMFQLIYDKNNAELKKLLQKYPGIVNEMPSAHIVKSSGGVVGWEENAVSALHYATVYGGRHEALCILLEHNANPNLQNYFGETALISAASFANLDCVKTLIEAGADKELKDKNKLVASDYFRRGDGAGTTSWKPYYNDEYMIEYRQAVEDGEAERDRYAAEKQAALERIQNFVTVQDLAAIVCGYAYGVLSRDLPKDLPEEKSWLATHCAIQ